MSAGDAAAAISRRTDPDTSKRAAERMVRSGRIKAQREAAVFLVDLYPKMTAKELAHLSLPHHDCTSLGATITDRYYALARRLPECPELEARDTGSRARVWNVREGQQCAAELHEERGQ